MWLQKARWVSLPLFIWQVLKNAHKNRPRDDETFHQPLVFWRYAWPLTGIFSNSCAAINEWNVGIACSLKVRANQTFRAQRGTFASLVQVARTWWQVFPRSKKNCTIIANVVVNRANVYSAERNLPFSRDEKRTIFSECAVITTSSVALGTMENRAGRYESILTGRWIFQHDSGHASIFFVRNRLYCY